MTSVEPLRFRVDPAGHSQRVDFSSTPRFVTIAFAVLWCSGWLLLLILAFLDYVRFGRLSVFFTSLLVLGGLPAALALLWGAWGKRESLVVVGDTITIEKRAGPFRLSRTFAVGEVSGIDVVNVTEGPFADLVAVRQFYSGGNGRLAFDTRRGRFSWGHDLPRALAVDLLVELRRLVPVLALPPVALQPMRSRLASHVSTFMTVTMFAFAFNVPTRLVITDRSICFYDESVTP